MDEASLCDRVALIQTGNMLSINTPNEIINEFGKPLLALRASDMLRLLDHMKGYDETEDCYPFGEYHHAVMKNGYSVEKLNQYLATGNFEQLDVKKTEPDIEDCFIALMKQ
jgi:ABC-type multidrug transport system ATPase subunit